MILLSPSCPYLDILRYLIVLLPFCLLPFCLSLHLCTSFPLSFSRPPSLGSFLFPSFPLSFFFFFSLSLYFSIRALFRTLTLSLSHSLSLSLSLYLPLSLPLPLSLSLSLSLSLPLSLPPFALISLFTRSLSLPLSIHSLSISLSLSLSLSPYISISPISRFFPSRALLCNLIVSRHNLLYPSSFFRLLASCRGPSACEWHGPQSTSLFCKNCSTTRLSQSSHSPSTWHCQLPWLNDSTMCVHNKRPDACPV